MGGLGADYLGMLRSGLWYLATVYTSHPAGLDAAYRDANSTAARVVSMYGARLFCPIAHSHSLCEVYGTAGGLPGETDADFWKWYDEPFLERCDGLLVTCMPGWRGSVGVTHEIAEMHKAGKPIMYLSWPDLSVMRLRRKGVPTIYAPTFPFPERSAMPVHRGDHEERR